MNSPVIFDVLYGFVKLTPWEQAIIDSPYFQRLRWIKQLGFSNYIFPGAEHNRFAHAIGVMHSMHQMVTSLGIAVPDQELFSSKSTSQAAMLHKCLRVSALLHDIGTFPFSHAIEYAYIRHGKREKNGGLKDLPNSHEHLGSFIIKNTTFEGGITRILEQAGLDVGLISKIIKGDSKYLIANQLMHSDLDADRMDYLNRDSYYTGLKYGQFDREYLLANLETFETGSGQLGFGIQENAMHAVEDFLIARFNWYSQVIKNPGSAKFDIMASHITDALLEQDLVYQFEDLLEFVSNRDERFFWWNDIWFMSRCQEVIYHSQVSDSRTRELVEMLLYRRAPKTLVHPLTQHRILRPGDRTKRVSQLQNHVRQMQAAVAKIEGAWILVDVPEKDVVFTSGKSTERDPIKITQRRGKPVLLIDHENSLMKHLSGFSNFVPNLYGNDRAHKALRSRGLVR